MNFKDDQIMNSTLISLKHLRVMYNYFTEEAGTPELFSNAYELFEEITQMMRATYDLMIEQGFMSVTPQSSQNIDKAYNQVKTLVEEMN